MASMSCVGVLLGNSILEEPGPLCIGNFSAPQHLVAHAVAAGQFIDGPGVHIHTVTTRTDIFATDRVRAGPDATTAEQVYYNNPLLRGLVNMMVVARFVYELPPRMPSLTDVIELLGAA